MTTKTMKTKIDKTRVCTLDELLRDTESNLPVEVEAMERNHSMGRAIVLRRVAAGLTQTELARRIGCTQSRISKLERSENDKISMVDFIKCTMATSTNGKISTSPTGLSQQIALVNWGMLSNFLEKLVEAAPSHPSHTRKSKRPAALA